MEIYSPAPLQEPLKVESLPSTLREAQEVTSLNRDDNSAAITSVALLRYDRNLMPATSPSGTN